MSQEATARKIGTYLGKGREEAVAHANVSVRQETQASDM
jgi:hypothetical protein